MNNGDLEELNTQLAEIEAVLALFGAIEESISPVYIAIIANEYLYKLKDIRKKIGLIIKNEKP